MGRRTARTLISALLVAGCTPGDAEPESPPRASPSVAEPLSTGPVRDLNSLVGALETAGYEIRVGDVRDADPFVGWPLAQDVCIGPVRVSVYEFTNAAAAKEIRSGVSRDGYGIPTFGEGGAHVDWIGPPHFFGGGKLIVLYIPYWRHDRRDERRTLDALELVLGPQFAGSDEGGRSTLRTGPAEDPCTGGR